MLRHPLRRQSARSITPHLVVVMVGSEAGQVLGRVEIDHLGTVVRRRSVTDQHVVSESQERRMYREHVRVLASILAPRQIALFGGGPPYGLTRV